MPHVGHAVVQDHLVDDIDRRIISELESNGRLTMYELGDAVGLSSSAAHRRMKALEERGVISGYRAVVDRHAIGRAFEVYVSIMLERTEPGAVARLEAALATVDEVVACHRLFGEPDYLVLVAVEDVAAYERLWARLSALPGAARVSSQMTMKVVKR
jgi:Lrp/AsnC family leucine-responsive transcriptional regulator